MAERPDPTPDAFLSYTRFDDGYHGGAITEFRRRLGDAMRAVTGRPFHIFQDVDGIGLGENWRSRLNIALGDARFFIPIVTPNFFQSEACREELETFLQFEQESGRDDLVLPIYWLRCRVLENTVLRGQDPLARIISDRQRFDWRDLRHKPYDHHEVRVALEALADQIEEARVRPVRIPRGSSATAIGEEVRLPQTSIEAEHRVHPPWPPLSKLLASDWILIFNPESRQGFKTISFNRDGTVGKGANHNETTWRVENEMLEILNRDQRIFSRFRYEARNGEGHFVHTNDSDTLSIRSQRIEPHSEGKARQRARARSVNRSSPKRWSSALPADLPRHR